ncbi:MAG: universal stress protein [Anaerolineae bacterium]|nr:universal stress protein [Anaerolineae bacterium]
MTHPQDLVHQGALRDFQDARRRAAIQDLKARLTGEPGNLLNYDEVAQMLHAEGTTRRGLQDVPLDAIVGSVGRYGDFTRTFLPRRDRDQERWAKIKVRALYQGGFPPIELYKIGDAYFVLDGNHRVSVLRQHGAETVQAYVTEVQTRVPLLPDDSPDELIIKARLTEFLERTGLDQSRPGTEFTVTAPGQYRVLEEQIEIHQRCLAKAGGDMSFQEAAADWHDSVYLPTVAAIDNFGLLDDFAERTPADLFAWVARHREDVAGEIGWKISPAAAADDLAARYSRRLPRVVDRWRERMQAALTPAELRGGAPIGQWRLHQETVADEDHLFPDILVPVSGTAHGWQALEQALVIARREGSELHGFHVVRSDTDREDSQVIALQSEFARRCAEAGVAGKLVVEAGPVTRTICQRARWTDLVVSSIAMPPGHGVAGKLGPGFHSLVRQCSRPVLAVPAVSSLSRAALAYDGSAKSDEALYVAAYLAGKWELPLAVITVAEQGRVPLDIADKAQDYLTGHGVTPEVFRLTGPVGLTILQTARDFEADMIILGGYGYQPMLEVMLGSAVDTLLRSSEVPLLICR